MGIVWKQTMRDCFNTFNGNFLVPRPPNLHKNMNKQQEITFYTVAKTVNGALLLYFIVLRNVW